MQDLKDEQEFMSIAQALYCQRALCSLFHSSGRVNAQKGPCDLKSMYSFAHTQ